MPIRYAYKNRHTTGFTLLEVILALAILGVALATLGQAVGGSHRNARRAADETELAIAAQTTLDEMLAGVRPLEPFEGDGVEDPLDPSAPVEIVVSAQIEASLFDGLRVLRVQARPNTATAGPLETVELVRWVVDADLQQATGGGGPP